MIARLPINISIKLFDRFYFKTDIALKLAIYNFYACTRSTW